MDKISVIIPTYNREQQIEKSIRSVLNQTYDNLEIIVVDDASTDHTKQVVEAIGDKRIHYIRQEENQGASAARNAGVVQAETKLIAFQDSDDMWRPDKLEKQMAYWNEHPEHVLIYSGYLMHRISGECAEVPYAGSIGALEGDIFETLLQNNTIGTPTILMRRDAFQAVGGFDTSLKCLEDWDFVLRLSKNYTIGYVAETLVDAYQLKGGISSNPGAFYLCRCRMIAKNRQELLDRGLFDQAVNTLFQKAERDGVLTAVQGLLMKSLTESIGTHPVP